MMFRSFHKSYNVKGAPLVDDLMLGNMNLLSNKVTPKYAVVYGIWFYYNVVLLFKEFEDSATSLFC